MVEIAFADAATLHYDVSLNFTIPDAEIFLGESLWVPVAFVPKHMLSTVDVWDEAGRQMPALNRSVAWDLIYGYMVDWWVARHHRAVDPQDVGAPGVYRSIRTALSEQGLLPWLRGIIRGTDKEECARRARGPLLAEAKETLASVQHQRTLEQRVALLAEWEIIFALMYECAPGARRIVRASFNDRSQRFAREQAWWWKTALKLTGPLRELVDATRGVLFAFHFPEAAQVESFHVELTAPDGMAIEDGVLRSDGRMIDASGSEVAERRLSRAHLYAHLPGTVSGEFLLAVAPRGWVRTAVGVAWISAASVTLTLIKIATLQRLGNANVAASVFLAAGAVGAVFVARPGAHPFTTERLAGARTWLWCSVVASLVAVWTLVFTQGVPLPRSSACAGVRPGRCAIPPREWFAQDGRWVTIFFAWLAFAGLLSVLWGPRLRASLRRQRRKTRPRESVSRG